MKKRIPYTEPLTPEETAEVHAGVEASATRMRANSVRLISDALREAWTDPDGAAITTANPPEHQPEIAG